MRSALVYSSRDVRASRRVLARGYAVKPCGLAVCGDMTLHLLLEVVGRAGHLEPCRLGARAAGVRQLVAVVARAFGRERRPVATDLSPARAQPRGFGAEREAAAGLQLSAAVVQLANRDLARRCIHAEAAEHAFVEVLFV